MAHESAKVAMQHYLDTRQFYEVVEYAVQETDIAKQLEQLAVEKEAITKQLEQLTGELQAVKQKLKEQQEQMSNNVLPGNQQQPHDDNEDVEGEVALAPAPEIKAEPAPEPGPREGSD
jgi:predicted  nucleic acid-binding Zn-ribbon protein